MKIMLQLFIFGIFPWSVFAADSNSVEQLLETLRKPKAGDAKEVYYLSENEVNTWSEKFLGRNGEFGVEQVRIDFLGQNRLSVRSLIDMDRIDLESFSAQVFQSVLSGKQEVLLVGVLKVNSPRAEFEVERTEVNGIEIPIWLVEMGISYFSSQQKLNNDLSKPFYLPFGLTGVDIGTDRMKLTR